MDFYKYLDQDFSSQPFLFTFCPSKLASKWAKSVGNSNFFQKSRQKLRNLKKSRCILKVLIVSISLDDLNTYLDTAKSQLKSLNFKNLDWDIKNWSRHDGHSQRFLKIGLDRLRNLDLNLHWSHLLRPPGLIILQYFDWNYRTLFAVFYAWTECFLPCEEINWKSNNCTFFCTKKELLQQVSSSAVQYCTPKKARFMLGSGIRLKIRSRLEKGIRVIIRVIFPCKN